MWPGLYLPLVDLTISSYHVLHVVAWFAFYYAGTTLTRSQPDLRRHWVWLVIGWAMCDTVGARVAFRWVNGGHSNGYFAAPLLAALFTGAYVVIRQIRAYPLLDAWAVAFSVAHVFEKAACLAAGCCFGQATTSPLGVALHLAYGDPTRVHPLPLYEMALHLLTALGLGWLYARGFCRGRLVIILGLVFGVWRAMAELVRGGRGTAFLDGPFTWTQVACFLAITFSLSYLLARRGRDSAAGTSA